MKKVFSGALTILLLILVLPIDWDTKPLWLVVPVMIAFAISGIIVASLFVAVIMSIVDRDY